MQGCYIRSTLQSPGHLVVGELLSWCTVICRLYLTPSPMVLGSNFVDTDFGQSVFIAGVTWDWFWRVQFGADVCVRAREYSQSRKPGHGKQR